MDVTADQYNLSPRMEFRETIAYVENERPQYCLLTLMDTERENEINLGTDWPFEPLAAGDCVVDIAYQNELKKEVGDTLILSVPLYPLINMQAIIYNELNPDLKTPIVIRDYPSRVTCTITGFFDELYGKFP